MVIETAGEPHLRVVWGTGTGPTAVASYDAALADAGVHDYNLASLSSVVPPGATVEPLGTAPNLGPIGGRLWTVQARTTTAGPARAAAALGWAVGPEGGVLYETSDAEDETTARDRVRSGLEAARSLRDRELAEERIQSVSLDVPDGTFGTAVVLVVYGDAEPFT